MTLKGNTDRTVNEHGGDLTEIRKRFPQVRNWHDLSTGISPNAYPMPQIPESAWQQLPDEDCMQQLRVAAGSYYGVPAEMVVPAPGTQSLIQWLPFLREMQYGKCNVQVASPTYNEHVTCWERAGHTVSLKDVPDKDADVVVITSPNNPDARIWSHTELEAYANTLKAKKGWLVIDEAYVDVTPAQSFASQLQGKPHVIILRSFGKFFGLAGLRLGFALADARMAQAIASMLGPWAVSRMATVVGSRALRDELWITRNREGLLQLANQRDALLKAQSLDIVGSHPLFCLVESPHAPLISDLLAQSGFYVRRFADRPTWLRIGAVAKPYLSQLEGALNNWQRHAA